MKNKILFWALIALAAYACNAPAGNETTKPHGAEQGAAASPAFVVPDSMFCATIAPLQKSAGKTSRAVSVRGSLWPIGSTIKIKLIGGSTAQRKYFTDAVAEWAKVVNLKFSFVTSGSADVRCAFITGSGSWSYIGTDAKNIPQTQPTINIGWLGSDVCLHEFGHALGMAHEQSSPNAAICWNKEAVYAALGGPPNNWSRETVDWNVFRTLTAEEAAATVFDPLSIMQYSIPASWLCAPSNGIPGGKVLSALDMLHMSEKYPFQPSPPPGGTVTISTADANAILQSNTARITELDTALQRLRRDNLKIKKAFGL